MKKILRVYRFMFWFGVPACLLFFTSSCVNTKSATYFNGIGNTTITPTTVDVEPVIQKNDLLSIYVSSPNAEANVQFNSINATVMSGSASQSIGYLVNTDGNIQFPVLGSIQAAGLTKRQFTEKLIRSFLDKKLLVDPIVNINFLNYRVTVLGEVGNPSVLNIGNEKVSMLEAIGLAGDLTIYAKRDNVLLIREENGVKTTRRINLNTDEIFTSPYYYLKSNDIVYVEPNSARIFNSGRSQQLLPIIFSALSFVVIIVQYLLQ